MHADVDGKSFPTEPNFQINQGQQPAFFKYFCDCCELKTSGAKFCGDCGNKRIDSSSCPPECLGERHKERRDEHQLIRTRMQRRRMFESENDQQGNLNPNPSRTTSQHVEVDDATQELAQQQLRRRHHHHHQQQQQQHHHHQQHQQQQLHHHQQQQQQHHHHQQQQQHQQPRHDIFVPQTPTRPRPDLVRGMPHAPQKMRGSEPFGLQQLFQQRQLSPPPPPLFQQQWQTPHHSQLHQQTHLQQQIPPHHRDHDPHPLSNARVQEAFTTISTSLQTIMHQTPPTWVGNDFEPATPRSSVGGIHLLVIVPRASNEFIRIQTNMLRSMPHAVICEIKRVQNNALWLNYSIKQRRIASEQNDGDANEIEAWHSTRKTDPKVICTDGNVGFDINRSVPILEYVRDASGNMSMRIHKTADKSYGTGIYLAEHALYSDTILPPFVCPISGNKQMIVAKVLRGNMMDYKSEVPDVRGATEPEGYHSISGTEHNLRFLRDCKPRLEAENKWGPAFESLLANGEEYGRQYVVHRSNQVYPAYIVTYNTDPQPSTSS